ncbi:MAG: two-component regulator propeller domain-containing protein [Calditrichota bacterium]
MQHLTLIKTILSFGFLFTGLLAQPAPEFRFQRIGLEAGLPTEHITAITQDSLGFMWIGTTNGLCRYDGEAMKTYMSDPEDSTSLFANHIQSLYTDTRGNIWIGAGGLNRYDAERDKFIRYNFTDLPNAKRDLRFPFVIKEDRYQNLWIGTFGYGLFKLHLPTAEIQQVDLGAHRGNSPLGRIIYSLFIDKHDSLWITSTGRQLTVIDLKTEQQFRHYWEDETDIQYIFNDSRGEKWLRRDREPLKKLRLKKNGELEITPFQTNAVPKGFGKITEDLKGRLWMGTQELGAWIIDPKAGRSYWEGFSSVENSSISSNTVVDLYRDLDGNIWIATRKGISLYSHWDKPFKHYQHDTENVNSLNDAVVTGIKQAADGSVWVSTRIKGFSRFDPERETFTRFESFIPGTKVVWALDIFPDSKGQVWIAGNLQNGLVRFDVNRNRYTTYRHNQNDSTTIGSNGINQIKEDHLGRIWVATSNGGLNLLREENNRFTRFLFDENDLQSPPSNTITVLNQPNDSLLFFGTTRGLGKMYLPSLKIARVKHNVKGSFIVHALHFRDSDNRMWLGTNRGLYYYDKLAKAIFAADSDNSILNQEVYGILEDDAGFLWLQYDNALICYSPENNGVRIYDRGNGWIQSGSTESGWRHSLEKLSNGEMLFGGVNGITRFNPSDVRDNPKPPPVHITGFRLFYEPVTLENNLLIKERVEKKLLQKPVYMTEELILNHSQNTFSFEFTALDYVGRSAIEYAPICSRDFIQTGFILETRRRQHLQTCHPASMFFA